MEPNRILAEVIALPYLELAGYAARHWKLDRSLAVVFLAVVSGAHRRILSAPVLEEERRGMLYLEGAYQRLHSIDRIPLYRLLGLD